MKCATNRLKDKDDARNIINATKKVDIPNRVLDKLFEIVKNQAKEKQKKLKSELKKAAFS